MPIGVNLRLKALINLASSQVSIPVASPLRRGRKEKIPVPPLLSRAVSSSGAIAKSKSHRLSDKSLSDRLKTNIYADSNLVTQKSQCSTPKFTEIDIRYG
jgi:hypothetical protein